LSDRIGTEFGYSNYKLFYGVNIKKFFFFLILLITYDISAQPVSLNRTMAAGDPNRNSSWDWTINQPNNLYANTSSGLVTYPNVLLPWFSNSGPASYLGTFPQIDFKKSDGWTLLYRDFGTPASGASPMPFFILYNKYRGLLRVFFYNSITLQGYSFAMLKLNLSGTSTSPLLTYSDAEKPFLDDFTTNIVVSSVFKMPILQWTFADLNIIGYDNSLSSKNLALQFELIGVNETDLKLSGGITLEQIVGSAASNANVGFTGKSDDLTGYLNAITSPASKAWNNFKSYYTAQNDLKIESEKTENQGKWYTNALKDISNVVNTSPTKFIPGFAAIAGFVDGVVGLIRGNTGQAPTPIPLNFRGNIQLGGKMTGYNTLANFYLYVPGTLYSSTDSRAPLDNTPIGVFNLLGKSTMEYCAETKIIDIRYDYTDYSATLWFAIKDPIQLVLNPSSNLRLISSKLRLGSNTGPETKYYNLNSYNETKYTSVAIANSRFERNDLVNEGLTDMFSTYVPDRLFMELKFVHNNNNLDTIYFLKSYPINIVYSPTLMNKTSILPPYNLNIVNSSGYVQLNWSIEAQPNISGYRVYKKLTSSSSGSNTSFVFTTSTTYTDFNFSFTNPRFATDKAEYWVVAVENPNNLSVESEHLSVSGKSTIQWKIAEDREQNVNILDYELNQNFPNPFNPETTISYQLPKSGNVTLKIFDILGKEVKTLLNQQKEMGKYTVHFDASSLASGMYVYQL